MFLRKESQKSHTPTAEGLWHADKRKQRADWGIKNKGTWFVAFANFKISYGKFLAKNVISLNSELGTLCITGSHDWRHWVLVFSSRWTARSRGEVNASVCRGALHSPLWKNPGTEAWSLHNFWVTQKFIYLWPNFHGYLLKIGYAYQKTDKIIIQGNFLGYINHIH